MAGYTRTDTTNNIADGNIINAADLDNEFDGIQAAFNSSTGHNHDGTTGEGAPILVVGPSQDVVVGSTTVTPKLTNTVDIGSSSLKFKDLYLAGTLNVTTIDTTNLEVTNIKAKDGTASITIADSTGAVSFANNVTLGDATTDTVTVNGYMGVGGAGSSQASIYASSTALTGTAQIGIWSNITATSAATGSVRAFNSAPSTAAASFTTTYVAGYQANNATKGAGSTITDQHGLIVGDLTSGTNNYGITSQVSSGTNKWNIYASGTAANYFGGNIGLGVAPSAWGSSYDVFEVRNAGNALWSSAANDMKLTTNVVHNGTNYTYAATAVAARYDQNTGQHVWYNAASGTAGDTISWTQAMTLNASGNLGLGVTPSAWGSGYNAFDVGNGYGLARLSTDGGILLTNAYFNGTNYIYKNSAFAAGYEQNDSIHKWFTAASGTAGATITFTQAMTLDASGRLLIGTTSSRTNNLSSASFLQLEAVNSSATGALVRNSADTSGAGLILGKSRGTSVGSVTAVASGDRLGTLSFSGTDGTSMLSAATIISEVDGTPGTNDMPGRLVFSTTADGASSPTERMRIDSSGNVGIGNDSPTVKLDVAGSTQSTWSATSTSISGTTMTIAGTVTGTIAIGDLVYGTGVQPYTRIVSGSATTWIVSVSQTVASATLVGGAVYSNTLIRISNTDTSEAAAQPTGGLQFYTSDASAPTAGVGAYVAALAETTTPDTALVFGTRDNGGGGVDANERMRIDSSGNLGIGTSSPVSKLHIESTSAESFQIGYSSTKRGRIGATSAGDLQVYAYETGVGYRNILLATDAGSAAGNVGIGTSSPSFKLDVTGTLRSTGEGRFDNGINLKTATLNYVYFDDAVSFTRNGTGERMRIDTSGNVGIGTSSPSGYGKLSVNGNVILGPYTRNQAGTQYIGIATAGDPAADDRASINFTTVAGASSSNSFITFSTNNYGVSSGERMRIDSSGQVGIGTSSPIAELHVNKDQNAATTVRISNATAGTTASASVQVVSDTTGGLIASANSTVSTASAITGGASGAGVYTTSAITGGLSVGTTAGPLKFFAGSTSTERARIDSNGNLLVGTTSADAKFVTNHGANNVVGRIAQTASSGITSDVFQVTALNHGTSTSLYLLRCYTSGPTAQFAVRSDGVVYAQNTTIQSISDARVKENVQDANEGLGTVLGLRPVRFDFKEGFGNNRKNQLGFIAQEVEAVFPDAVDVSGEKDETGDPYKSVGPGALIPVLVKAIQEQQAIITALTARVAALESN